MTEPHPAPSDAAAALSQVVREQWGRLTALLLARYRRVDLVEDALADAVERAARAWPEHGVPDNPAAWLNTAAQRRILDQLRAEKTRRDKLPLVISDTQTQTGGADTMADLGDVSDDLLRLVLMCAHPALPPEGAAALSLRLVLGVSTADIARLFRTSEATMAARITRAKKKIALAGIGFTLPHVDDLPDRVETVAQVAYLGFTAGYAPGSGDAVVRADLAGEAIRLVRVVRALRPDEPVLRALLALMALQHSRRDARVDARGELVLLDDQDRTLWHHDEIDEALALLRELRLDAPQTRLTASYALQARIAAEHAVAPSSDLTRWDHIVRHYDLLLQVTDSPAARLARGVAVAQADGPLAGLASIKELDESGSHRVAAVRAELLHRAEHWDDAVAAYDRALVACGNEAEVRHLTRRRDQAQAHER